MTEPAFNRQNGPGLAWLLIILALILLAVAVSIFGKSTGSGPLPSATIPVSGSPDETRQTRIYTVTYDNGVFSPTNLRIHAGDTVRFKNESVFAIHIASDPGPQHLAGFDSVGDIPQGSYFSYTFSAPGIFGYHDEHDSSHTGTIIVR